MYHKAPDQQDMTLAEWNRQLNEAKPVKPNQKSKTGDVVDPIQGQLNMAIRAGKKLDGGQDMARPSKKQKLINKLKLEKDEGTKALLQMDDEIIDGDEGLSEGQRGLLKIQRSAMKTIVNVLNLRIKDLED